MNKNLQDAIEELASSVSFKNLTTARDLLTSKYRDETRHGKHQAFMDSHEAKISYLTTRFPATYATITSALEEIKKQMPDLLINTLNDLGAGPGTAFFAASSLFSIQEATLIEQDEELIRLGKILQEKSGEKGAFWQKGKLETLQAFPKADLTIISYALNELDEPLRKSFIEKAWQATDKVLLIIEPGTPQGFSLIKQARSQLITFHAHMVAPCPHSLACPMPENDWCHFSKRVNRSSLHRQIKNATLSYEDEKFSYIAVSKVAKIDLPEARILRHPEKHSGHLILSLCTNSEGLIKKTLSKKDGPLYKAAKKLEWGGAF